MKHLLFSIASIFHHHSAAKPPVEVLTPALEVRLLNRSMPQLTISDETKLICVYPLATKQP
jgi:hypothetical protein